MEELQGTVGTHGSSDTVFGGEGDDESGEAEVADAEPDVSDFLDQQQAGPVEEVEAPRPTWTMDIYVGNDTTTHEWEIPEEEQQQQDSAAAGAEALKSAVQWMFAPGA